MKQYYFNYLSILSIFLFFVSCFNRKNAEETVERPDNIIRLSDAIINAKDEILLSEWVDSVSYIPLETNNSCLLGKYPFFEVTPQYIYYLNNCFEWTGKFVSKIGKLGPGPCEEPGRIISKVAFNNDFFYTLASKLIEYDKNGNCTGKEKSIYKLENQIPYGQMLGSVFLAKADKNLITFNYPDTVFFINTDFDIVNTRAIMDWPSKAYIHDYRGPYDKFISYYKDTTLFYNYYTDTVYTVTNTTLEPKWIVELNKELRLSSDFIYKYNDLLRDALKFWENKALDGCKMVEIMDHKITISSVHETNHSIFLLGAEMMAFRKLRNLPPSEPPFIAHYDKHTGKTIVVKKIIDDLGGMDTFLPLWGVCNEKMINAIWPYQLEEFIEKKRSEGKTVDKRLLELSEKVDTEDNPILIIAHLKKSI